MNHKKDGPHEATASLHRMMTRLRNLMTGRQDELRLKEEMEAHLAAQTEDNIRAGMTIEEARRCARMRFGAIGAIQEGYRDEKSLPLIENLLLDIRYAFRALRKAPAFTAVAFVTLTLGIGANVVVFGLVNAILLQPLGVNDPASLYQMRHQQWAVGRLLTTSYPAFEDFRRRNTTFSGMAAVYGYGNATLRWGNAVRKLNGDEVTANYFDLLGTQPAIGHFFSEKDEHGPNSTPYVVLSNELWRTAFNGDPAVIGTTVDLNRYPFIVIGIASARFHGMERFVWPDYWIPMANEQQVEGHDYLRRRASVSVTVLGRLKPGLTQQQATDNLNAISAQLAREYPRTDDGEPLRLIHPGLWGDEGDVIRGFLWSVTALALLVLAAACANLASLFAARASDRSRELALRVALGSSRQRLVRQLLTEAVMVSLIGGAAGLASAAALLGALSRWPELEVIHLAAGVGAEVYLAGLALTLGSALLFGLAPSLQVWRSSPLQMMKDGPAGSPHLRRLAPRDILLGTQVAICTLLVMASFVALRGMIHALEVPLGFQPRGAMLAEVDLSQLDLPDDARLPIQKAMIEAARNIPGVTAAAIVSHTPFTGGMHGVPIFRPGTTEFTLNNSVLAPYVFSISPGYLNTAGTRLFSGRDVAWQDSVSTPNVAIVNQTFAHRMWGDTPALGQHFIVTGQLTEVVGVTEDGKYHDLEEVPQPMVYRPISQTLDEGPLVVRSQRPASEMTAALERGLSQIEPNAPITVQNWSVALDSQLFPAQAATLSLGVMGLLAAMLAVTGIFGMAAYTVSRRMKELGIRLALGARKTQVMTAAVGRPLLLLGAGSLLGLVMGIFATRLLQRIVYQANPGDPVVVGGVVFTMVLLGIAAAAIPARRALAADPSKLMREE